MGYISRSPVRMHRKQTVLNQNETLRDCVEALQS
jgi:hypothetical protein